VEQCLDLVFVLRMQRGQHGAESKRTGGQQQMLDRRVDRCTPRDRSWSWPGSAGLDAGEDQHGHGGHLLRAFRPMPVWLVIVSIPAIAACHAARYHWPS
jgi:hypothetical protein